MSVKLKEKWIEANHIEDYECGQYKPDWYIEGIHDWFIERPDWYNKRIGGHIEEPDWYTESPDGHIEYPEWYIEEEPDWYIE